LVARLPFYFRVTFDNGVANRQIESLHSGSGQFFWANLEIIASEPSTLANSHDALLVLI
jgi:hypothetical protein